MAIEGVKLTRDGERTIRDASEGIELSKAGMSMRRLAILAVCKPNDWHSVTVIHDRVQSSLSESIDRDDILKGIWFLAALEPPLVELAHKQLTDLHTKVLDIITRNGGGITWSNLLHALRRPDHVMPHDLEQQVTAVIAQSNTLRILNYNSGSRKFVYFI